MTKILRSKATFELLLTTDTLVLLVDLDQGASVTNDADAAVRLVSRAIGGIWRRRVYYRDTLGSFNELVITHECFTGFKPVTPSQCSMFSMLVKDRAAKP